MGIQISKQLNGLTASWLLFSVKYLYQPQKSECSLYQLMFLRWRTSLLCASAAADLSLRLSAATEIERKKKKEKKDVKGRL